MTKTQGILNILEAAGIAEDKKVGESTAFDVLENAIEGALDDIESADDDDDDDDDDEDDDDEFDDDEGDDDDDEIKFSDSL